MEFGTDSVKILPICKLTEGKGMIKGCLLPSSRLGGVVVSVLATGPKGWGSNPAKAMDI
jgi:hypothetical protein